ncbi:sigma 54-interacting transcriptional regulator [Proteiniborus sp. MB09-C3]|uniref:sigma-54 interaction domain-containing protein n=1 Tax=Proteiniborus sp. MB09-C3 TaxID=3050072 RepID=UPI0025553ECC|nr:sigma 54-interacting transcriptional regulator [Proteiniborus sp. MB09-C3]WIV11980.1 sigma 54-interacting transcriptional regulator [Proteiniborus sp. MB09-C3]
MEKIFYTLLGSLPIIARVTAGYAALTNRDGKRIKTVDSIGNEVIELKGVYYDLAKEAAQKEETVHGMSQLELGAETWCVPIGDYVLCCSNVERVSYSNALKQSLIDALPFIARVAGGEAVVFDSEGKRLASINSNGEMNAKFLGAISKDANEAMKKQKPVIGESNYISGASAVRIPMGKDFGFGFNNEDQIQKNNSLMNEMKKYQNVKYNFSDIIGKTKEIDRAKEVANIAAQSNSNVLIFGETGTGKEVFAQSIHNASNRFNKPFVAINCAAIPQNLMESSFFGYEDGAFTGAKKGGAPGVFEQANGGTLFLDEISEMHLDLQSKILRVLQEREVRRIGSQKEILLDIRVISASNKDLDKLVKEEKFRQDLFYRLNVLDINLPSLRYIRDDIPLLVNHAIRNMNITFGKFVEGIDEEALNILINYNWPGNVRELMNCIEKAFNIIGNGRIIKVEHLPRNIKENFNITDLNENGLDEMLQKYEKEIIEKALSINDGIKSKTADYLKISTTTLWRKMNQLNIESE